MQRIAEYKNRGRGSTDITNSFGPTNSMVPASVTNVVFAFKPATLCGSTDHFLAEAGPKLAFSDSRCASSCFPVKWLSLIMDTEVKTNGSEEKMIMFLEQIGGQRNVPGPVMRQYLVRQQKHFDVVVVHT